MKNLLIFSFVLATLTGCDVMQVLDGNCVTVYNNAPGHVLIAKSSDSLTRKEQRLDVGGEHTFTASGYDISIILTLVDYDGYQNLSQVVSVPSDNGFSGCSTVNVALTYDSYLDREYFEIQKSW